MLANAYRRVFLATSCRRPTQLRRFISSVTALPSRSHFHIVKDVYATPSQEQHSRLFWGLRQDPSARPRTALIIKKINDNTTTKWQDDIANWLVSEHDMKVLIEPSSNTTSENIIPFSPEEVASGELSRAVDFVISLGGDGTLLHASSLFRDFKDRPPPPVIAFHLGTVGVLMPFDIEQYKDIITSVVKGGFPVSLRMRLACDIIPHPESRTLPISSTVLNEITLHRALNPHVASIQCTINNHTLATVVADGLIVGTATGSTAYSMWCGGPMIHPSVQCILLTPINPCGIAKPSILPDDAEVTLKVASRPSFYPDPPAVVSLDGRRSIPLNNGDVIAVRKASQPMITVANISTTADWVRGNVKLIDTAETSSNQWLHNLSRIG